MDIVESNPLIVGERVILRLPEMKDSYEIIKYYLDNKEYLSPYEPLKSEDFYTVKFWELDIENRIKDYKEGRSLRMFVFDKTDNTTVIGVVNFNQIVRGAFHAAYLGYNIAEQKQGQGYMTESLNLAIEYVFTDLNLHRIMANYMPHNRRSGNFLKRLGFNIEGYARDYLYINGYWEDHILTSLTNKNWENRRD